jgi:hypothetical protein
VKRSGGAAAALAGIASALLVGTPIVYASPNAAEDGADTFNVASGTAVTGTTAMVVFSVPSTSPSMVVTCTASSFAGKTGTTLAFGIGLPSFSDGGTAPCNDNLGFTDTFQSNSTNGKWMLVEKDFTNAGLGDEGLAEPNSKGDRMVIRLPKGGLTDTNNWPCTLVFAPSGTAAIGGAYNDAGTLTIKGAKVPVTVSGPTFCGPVSQTVTVTVTYKLSPAALFDQG